jgi:hypothetical protein
MDAWCFELRAASFALALEARSWKLEASSLREQSGI